MKISELSRRSGVPLATIKFYLREGLISAGTPTGRNQADYSEEHLRRLRLIRALTEVGGLTVATVRNVLASVDDSGQGGHDLMGVASCAIAGQSRADRSNPDWQAARAEATALVEVRGWRVHPQAAALDQLADAIAALRSLDQHDLLSFVDAYADAAEALARREVTTVAARLDRASVVEGVITGTILGEVILTALRRLAQEHVSYEINS